MASRSGSYRGLDDPVAVGEGWQLLKIRGIPLRIHPTWFFIMVLATLGFEQQYRLQLSAAAPWQVWAVALATALLLFVSVLLHELGHSLVALSQGVRVRSITLFLLGGVASVERECSTAIGALLVAAAGPAVSLFLAALLLTASHGATHLSPLLGPMVEELGTLNLVLGLFNLLPGLPLDGGLILKALVWQITGSQRRGLEVANASGRLLSLLAVTLGVLLILRGAGIGGAWLMLLGWFGLGASRNQRQLLQIQRALRELQVKDVAQRRYRVVEASATLRQLVDQQLGTAPGTAGTAVPGGSGDAAAADWVLVCDRGRWQGVIDEAPLQSLPVQRWDVERVSDHLRPLASLPSIAESAPLWQATLQLDEPGCQRLLVLSPAGLPSGTLERPELGEAVLRRLGIRVPPPLLAAARRSGTYPLGLALAQVARGMVGTGEAAVTPAEAESQASR